MRAAMGSGERERIAALLAPGFVSADVRGNTSNAEKMIESVVSLDVDRWSVKDDA